MSQLIRHSQSRERPLRLGAPQILEVSVAVEILTPSGVCAAGASAHGTATLIAAPVARSVAGASAQATATHIGVPVGHSVAGASTQGAAAKIATVSGVCVAGSLAHGVESSIHSPVGTNVAGALTYGVASLIASPSGSSVAGASANGVATSGTTPTPTGISVAGASAHGVAAAIASPIGHCVAGASSYGIASAVTTPTPIGHCFAGASSQGVAAKIATSSGTSVAGSLTYGTASQAQIISVSGVCSAGASAYGVAAQGGDVVMDTQVIPLAQALRDCLCAWASVNPNPPQICCFRIGSEIAHDAGIHVDQCCEGIAYVSIGDLWPSTASFPEQDVVRQANSACYPPAWGVSLRAGLIRCAPTGDENPATCDEYTAAHIQVANDSQALRKAACCFRAHVRSTVGLEGMSVVIERQVQSNILGGCMERYFTISVQIPNLDCC